MKKQHIILQIADKAYLENILATGSLPVKTFRRASALLALDRGKTFEAVAQTLSVSNETVASWASKYKLNGLLFLKDKARSGRPIEIDGLQRAKITALACSQAPEGYGRWSLRLLADKVVELNYCQHLSPTYAKVLLKKMS